MSTLDSPVFVSAVTAVLGVFGGGTVVSLLKLPADKNRVVIEAAQGAVVLQTGVLESLRSEVARLYARVDEMEKEMEELRKENRQLRQSTARRLKHLEHDDPA